MSRTTEILSGALDALRSRGWCKYQQQNEQGHMCATGAICLVEEGDANRCPWNWMEDATADTDWGRSILALNRCIPQDFLSEFVEPKPEYATDSSWTQKIERVVCYNNSRTDFTEIEQWFEKAAADERIEL